MNEPFINIPPIARHEVSELIYSGNKIAAIKRYREAANCDLMTAKQAVEELTGQLKNTNPALFREEPPKNIKGVAAFFAILIIGVLAAKNFPENLKNLLCFSRLAVPRRLIQNRKNITKSIINESSTNIGIENNISEMFSVIFVVAFLIVVSK